MSKTPFQLSRICIICQGRQTRHDGLIVCSGQECPLDELAMWKMELLELMKLDENEEEFER